MSEAIPGFSAPPPARVRDAAVVILYRRVGDGVETYWIKREATLTFAGGYYAFPGGRVDATDGTVPMEGALGPDLALKVAAARELFEETGVLLARGIERVTAEQLSTARRELLDRKASFSQLLARHGLTLRGADFQEAGRWITPAFLPVRFDARFFLAEAPAHPSAEHWPGELAEGAWIRPQDALNRWKQGSALLHPPNLYALQTLAGFKSVEQTLALLKDPPHLPGNIPSRIEFQQGVRVFPLETPTLPPATHTNTYVLGNGELLIVDPGAAAVRQYARLLALLAGLKAEGKRPLAVFLTHHHADHIGGARAVADRLSIPIWCHERTADRLDFNVDRLLADGEVISLSGLPTMKWRVVHTPGHARGHLCLVDEASRAAVVGDMVAGTGTIVIDPPEGDMTDYLEQLRRLRDLPVGVLYPAHGAALPDGPAKLAEYLRHREMREKKVVDALSGPAGATLQEIVLRAYDDVPPFIHPIAERSTQAVLIKLGREGRVQRKDERYLLMPAEPKPL